MNKQIELALAMYDLGMELNVIETITRVSGAHLLWYWIDSKDESTV